MKHSFALAASVTLLAAVQSVNAQQTASQSLELEEVVVTGQRLARMKSLDIKRNANTIMDVMAADNLGRLPDKNAAESINRLPGVSVLIEKGEGRFASIRGIRPDWNRVTVNGFETGSPEKDGSGRQMPLDVLGGELLQQVEIFKAHSADMDGQGIGGTVNIVSKRPLRGEDFSATVNLRVGMEESDQDNPFYDTDMPYNGDIALSGKLNDNIGWILGASTSHRQYLAQGIYQDDWAVVGDVAYPEQSKNNYYTVGRERDTFIAGLEFALSENTTLMAQAFHSKFEEFQHRNRFRQGIEQDADLISSIDGNVVTMLPGGTFIQADLRREDVEKTLSNFSLSGSTNLDSMRFDYGFNVGKNEIDEPNWDWRFRQDSPQDLGPDSFSVGGDGVVNITEGGLQHNQASNLKFREVRRQRDRGEQDIFSVKFDAEFDFELAGLASTAKVGAKFTSNEKEFDYASDRYRIQDDNLADYNVTRGAFQNDVDGRARSNLWFDLDALNALFSSNPELFEFRDSASLGNDLSNDRSVEEEITAVYAMNTLQINDLQLIMGVRYEQTDVSSTGKRETEDGFQSVTIDGDSNVVLPSLIANYRLSDSVILRASITTSIGRPDYEDISATSSFEINADGDGELTIGNPSLEPYEALNYDLAAEWYPSESSIVSFAWFRKDIDNYIIKDELRVDGGIYQGINYDIDRLYVTTSFNADEAEVDGFEINLQHQFTNLPAPFNGLGATYSYTSIDASFYDRAAGFDRTLEDQPEELQSFTLFYEAYNVYVGLTYNYSDAFLTDINALDDPQDDITQGEFGRWDLRASYAPTDKLSVYLDINNLNNEPTTEFQGNNEQWNTEYEYVGSTYYLGMTYAFD